MKGKITSWKNDKGFGFITPDDQSENIFFHISSVKQASRKPEIGDTVVFEVLKDSKGRFKASHVLLEGASLANLGATKKIVTEPVKKDGLDYFGLVILALLFAMTLILFFFKNMPELALVSGAIFIVTLILLQSRKKQPANKLFTCSKCRPTSKHDERTILAWNRGFNSLYCKSCHQIWLREQPKDIQSQTSYSSKSGCFGLFVVFASLPFICVIGIIKWIS